jgi:hypothetical protein
MNHEAKLTAWIEVEINQDRNVTFIRVDSEDFEVTGSSRRDPADEFDPTTGKALAASRAFQALAAKYAKLAQSRMNEQANNRLNREKAKAWHKEQAEKKDRALRREQTLSYYESLYGERNKWATGMDLLKEGSGLDAAREETQKSLTEALNGVSYGGRGLSCDRVVYDEAKKSLNGVYYGAPGDQVRADGSIKIHSTVSLLLQDGRTMNVFPDGSFRIYDYDPA